MSAEGGHMKVIAATLLAGLLMTGLSVCECYVQVSITISITKSYGKGIVAK